MVILLVFRGVLLPFKIKGSLEHITIVTNFSKYRNDQPPRLFVFRQIPTLRYGPQNEYEKIRSTQTTGIRFGESHVARCAVLQQKRQDRRQ